MIFKNKQIITSIQDIANLYTTFFFDMDGVIWNGPKMIQGSIEALKFLQQANKNIFFITNSSSKSALQIWQRLRDNNFNCPIENIYSSNRVLGLYLKDKHPQIKHIYIIGNKFMEQQITQTGIKCTLSNQKCDNMNLYEFKTLISNLDPTVNAVASGFDYQMNFRKLCMISLYIQNGKPWFATGQDKYIMCDGYKLPGAGNFVAQISTVTDSTPIIIGKPNSYVLRHIIKKYQLNEKDCIMVGDNLTTDIQIGINGGIDTLCTMTGVTKWQHIQTGPQATYYTQKL